MNSGLDVNVDIGAALSGMRKLIDTYATRIAQLELDNSLLRAVVEAQFTAIQESSQMSDRTVRE